MLSDLSGFVVVVPILYYCFDGRNLNKKSLSASKAF